MWLQDTETVQHQKQVSVLTEEQLFIPPLQKSIKLSAKHRACVIQESRGTRAARRPSPALCAFAVFFCIYFSGFECSFAPCLRVQHFPVASVCCSARTHAHVCYDATYYRWESHHNWFSDSKSTTLWHWEPSRRLPDTFKPLGQDHSIIQSICFRTKQKPFSVY